MALTAAAREHELRNQLTIIQGFAELLARAIPGEDPRHEDAVIIRQAATTALRLLSGDDGTPGTPPDPQS